MHQSLLFAAPFGAIAIVTNWSGAAIAQTVEANPESQEIVVVGTHYGAANAPTETELDEQAIGDYAADSVGDLMRQISPLIDGSDDEPILIVNGQRIADPRDIRGYPPEALQRAEILDREAAGRYGYPPERRIVNLVLKRNFGSLSSEIGLTVPTALGRDAETLGAQRTAIARATRWNVETVFKRESLLLESERDVPAGAADGPQLIKDVLTGASMPGPRDDAAYRSLAPATRSIAVNGGVNRTVGTTSLSLNLRAQSQHSRQLLGLPVVGPPLGSPFLTLEYVANLARSIEAQGPLTASQDTTGYGASGGAAFNLLGVNGTLGLVYDHSEAVSRTMRGFELGDRVDAFRPLPLGTPLVDKVRSSSDNWSANLSATAQPIDLPAGAVQLSASGGFQHGTTTSDFDDASGSRRANQSDSSGDMRVQLQLPIASGRANILSLLGDLQLNLSGGAVIASGAPIRTRRLAGISWSPFTATNLNLRLSREDDGPSDAQRNQALVETPGVRIYDYATGELAEVVQVTGGNPDLARGTRSTFALGGFVRPFTGRELTFNFDYQRQTSKGGVGTLPALTPPVETAFPDRVQRDSSGRLVRVDQRTINIALEKQSSLNTGISLMLPLGASAPGSTAGHFDHSASEPPRQDRSRAAVARGAGRFQLSLNHRWQIENSLLIREGLPLLDRLRGEGGGQSRHELQLSAMIARSGAGLSLEMRWQSPYRTRASAEEASDKDLHFAAHLSTNLRVNLDLGRAAFLGNPASLRGTRVTLAVENLFDARQRVTRPDGAIPPGYTRDEIDPIGRTIGLALRRRF